MYMYMLVTLIQWIRYSGLILGGYYVYFFRRAAYAATIRGWLLIEVRFLFEQIRYLSTKSYIFDLN